jgi:hypothetical protein
MKYDFIGDLGTITGLDEAVLFDIGCSSVTGAVGWEVGQAFARID